MAFVKLDCGMLDSTLWVDREARELLITALLMAGPHELKHDTPTLKVRSLDLDSFTIPCGWYGFVPAAGTGIIRRAGLTNEEGLEALERLASPDLESRTPDHEGRRMVRIDGGYIILNYDKYRQKDYTAAERSRRYRERKAKASRVTNRSVTQAEAEAEAERKKEGSLSLGEKMRKALDVNPACQEVDIGNLRDAVGELFRRGPANHWSHAEEYALLEVARRPCCMAELSTIDDYLRGLSAEDRKFKPRTVLRLLERWTEMIDEANNAPVEGVRDDYERELEAAKRL